MSEFNFGIELERQLYGHEVAGRTLAYRMTVRVTRAHRVDPISSCTAGMPQIRLWTPLLRSAPL